MRFRTLPVSLLAILNLLLIPVWSFAAEVEWLNKYLPPEYEGGMPFTIKKVEVTRNHVEQELIKADYERTPQAVRAVATEIKLVLLPVVGGHHEAWADSGIGISPRLSGTINGITDSLLDFRGTIPGGARAYIEMTLANAIKKQEPVRISNVFWIGTDDELQTAKKKNPANPNDKNLKSIALKSVTDAAVVPAGMPVRLAAGPNWLNGIVMDKGIAGQPLQLILYAARPGGLYLPWQVTANRGDVKIETVAAEAVKTDATWFDDHLRQVKSRLNPGSAPLTLRAAGKKVAKGDRVVWFGMHGLMGGEALGDSLNGRVKVRDSRFNQESELAVGDLFVDPEPPAK